MAPWLYRPLKRSPDAFEKRLKECFDTVEQNRRSVAVEFEKNYYPDDHHGKVLSIDAVPSFECDNDNYEIPDKVTGTWIKTNPAKHREQATAKNKELGGSWVQLVKMVKAWNRASGKPIKPSFLVEVMARGLVEAPFSAMRKKSGAFFAAAEAPLGDDWPDPAGLGAKDIRSNNNNPRPKAKKILRSTAEGCIGFFGLDRAGVRAKRYKRGAKFWATTFRFRRQRLYSIAQTKGTMSFDMIKEIFDYLGYAATLVVITSAVAGFVLWVRGIAPVLIRLGNGLSRRKIALFAKGDQLSSLEDLLRDSKLFNHTRVIKVTHRGDFGKAEPATVYLVFWPDWKDELVEIVRAKRDGVALIVYAPHEHGPIPKPVMVEIEQKRNVMVCNFLGRLLNDIVVSMITTGYERS